MMAMNATLAAFTRTEWIELVLPMALALGFCLLVSFFLSGMETGLFEMSRLRVRRMMREGDVRAARLQSFLDDPEDCLWTILVGNTLANFFAVLLVLLFLQNVLDWGSRPLLFWLMFSLGGLGYYALFELLPKMLFRQYPNRLCLWLSRPFAVVHGLMRPLVWVLRLISRLILTFSGGRAASGRLFGDREELRQVMQESSAGLTADERVMIDRVLDLQSIPVRAIVTPLQPGEPAMLETPVIDLLQRVAADNHVHVPVWKLVDGTRRVAGVINVRQLTFLPEADQQQPVGTFLESALFMEEDTRLEMLLRAMQRSGQRVVIVLDRRQREIGLVRLADILGTVFGKMGR